MTPVEHFQCHCWNCYWHSWHCYFVLVQNCYCLVKCSSLFPRHQVQHNCWIRVCHGANLHLQSQCRKSLETIQCSTIIKVRLTSYKYHMFVILLEYLHCLTPFILLIIVKFNIISAAIVMLLQLLIFIIINIIIIIVEFLLLWFGATLIQLNRTDLNHYYCCCY